MFQLKDSFGVGHVAFLIQISEAEILLGYFFWFLSKKSKVSYITLN